MCNVISEGNCSPLDCVVIFQVIRGNSIIMLEALERV